MKKNRCFVLFAAAYSFKSNMYFRYLILIVVAVLAKLDQGLCSQKRIVGGNIVPKRSKDYFYNAQLGYSYPTTPIDVVYVFCGGTLISLKYVVLFFK